MRIPAVVGVACFVLGARLAAAQPAAPAADPPPPPSAEPPSAAPPGAMPPSATPPVAPSPAIAPAAPTPRERHVDQGVLDDANASRGWMTPTALTEPGGTWSISDYELFLLSLGYAPTDQLSLSVTTIPPLTTDFPLWLLFSAKYQFLKAGRLRAAAQGAVTYFSLDDNGDNDSFSAGDLGGALTLCIDEDCRSHVSGFVGAGFAHDNQSSVPFVAAGTLVAALGKHAKFVAEIDSAFIAGEINDVADGALLWYGLRFTSSRIGVDLGFVRPIGVSDSSLLLGIPILTFSYRNLD